MAPTTLLPQAFVQKKATILSAISTPSSAYTDLSPKGSIDASILPLLETVNALDGLVTTSSCAGRISVFLEGRRSGGAAGGVDDGDREGAESQQQQQQQTAVSGGKGLGGRWLFVSHDPIRLANSPTAADDGGDGNGDDPRVADLLRQFSHAENIPPNTHPRNIRSIRLQFEPMILHVLAASLSHARPILAAALAAGFRESGVQGLRNLDRADALPMVAVRSAGLGFSAVIGYVWREDDEEGEEAADGGGDGDADRDGGKDGKDGTEVVRSLVGPDALRLLLGLANERFEANAERVRRFRECLVRERDGGREDGAARARRKREEGLRERESKMRDGRADAEEGYSPDGVLDGGLDVLGS